MIARLTWTFPVEEIAMAASDLKPCRNCGSSDRHATEVGARGGYGPDLLPLRTGFWGAFKTTKYRIEVCGACGLTEWFVPERYLGELRAVLPQA